MEAFSGKPSISPFDRWRVDKTLTAAGTAML
jgi:hypothetical protein